VIRITALLCFGIGLMLHGAIAADGQPQDQQVDQSLDQPQDLQLPVMKPALLVIDIQNIWLPFMAAADRDSAPAKVNEAISLFRKSGNPVIAVYHTDPKLGPQPETEAFRFPDWVGIEAGDPVVVKNYPNSFRDTALDSILTEEGCNAVFLCGLSATGCVLATYFGAEDRDYVAFMVDGALISPKPEHTKMVEEISNSVTLEELATLLKGKYRLETRRE
jgi:nicotinamidase-related amidase